MRREVLLPDVGLHFHNSADGGFWTAASREPGSNEASRCGLGVIAKQVARKYAHLAAQLVAMVDRAVVALAQG
jgi:hypothetical protein